VIRTGVSVRGMDVPEVFDDRRCGLGEGPHYDERTGRVWWVDVFARLVLWRHAVSGERGELAMPAHVGAAVPRRTGGLVACLPDGVWAVDGAGAARALARYPAGAAGAPALRSNDAKADPRGRLWVGTMAYDQTPGAGTLYKFEGGALEPVVPDVTVSNGLAWSPDASTMYYVDTTTRRIDAFAYDVQTGALGGRRTFAEVTAGFPDGLCVDASGGVWVALWDGSAVQRYAADGSLDRMIKMPTSRVTSCSFAGDRFQYLVITTAARGLADDPAAGLTYAYEPGDVVGMPVDRCAG
jgi:sugar lactone lactonase YvrE